MEGMEVNPIFWQGKKVLVTGHTGFKGSWLCTWLHKLGAQVTGLSLEEPVSSPDMYSILRVVDLINDLRGDISDYNTCFEVVKKVEPEIVFHMAAQPLVRLSYLEPLKTYSTNILGTANILEASRQCNSVRTIVAITTDKCYENIEKDYAYVESDVLGGHDPYSSSKACAEHVASAYYRSYFNEKGVGLATTRAGNVIGGGDWSLDRLIPDTVRAWTENKKVVIRYPLAARPWQYVLEPLNGYLTLAEHLWEKPDEFSGGWNFGPDQNSVKTVKDTVELAGKSWGNAAEYDIAEGIHLHEAHLLQLSSKKAQTKLRWNPRLNFEEAINITIQWYKQYYSSNENLLEYTLQQITQYEGSVTHA